DLADSLGMARPYRAVRWRAFGLVAVGAPEGEPEFKAALEQVVAAGDTPFAMFMLEERVQALEGAAALGAMDEAAAFAKRYGLTDDRLTRMRVELLEFLGRWDDVLEAIPPLIARAELQGAASTRFALEWVRGIIELERGVDIDLEGLKVQGAALGLEEHFFAGVASRLAYLRGDFEASRRIVVETLDRLPDGFFVTAVFFVTTAIAAGDLPLAHRVLTHTYPESTPRLRSVLVKLARGLVLEAEGDLDGARQLFAEAVAWLVGRTRSLPTQEALFALGRAQVALGEIDEGLVRLREARSVGEDLKTAHAIARIDAAIESATRRSGERAAEGR
ncbi:MAG TPA: hypothetical protein VF484_02565, partial [Candidatus Limnocylindrales bacterium]